MITKLPSLYTIKDYLKHVIIIFVCCIFVEIYKCKMCLMLQHLNILVNIIINTYYNNSNCAFLITASNGGFNYQGLLPVINIKLEENTNELADIQNALQYGCQDIIIQTDNPEITINNFEAQIMLQVQRFNQRRYFVVPTEMTEDLMELPSIPTLHFVPDVLVAVPQIDYNNMSHTTLIGNECETTFQLITHKFVGQTGNDDVVILDFWYSANESFKFKANLFPDKITDTQGRVFKVATFSYKPYAIIGDTMSKTDGTEIRVALEYARKHNATIEFVVDDVHEWGEIYDNWTGNGILGNVVMDNADIGLGALYTWYHEFTFLDLSLPVVRTGITCLAPAPRLLSGLLVPFFPFNLVLWIAVIASFIVCVLSYAFVYYTNYYQRKRINDPDLGDPSDKFVIFLMMIRIYLLQSWPTIRSLDKPPIRYLLSAILVFCLLLATCYNSGLASSMTVPRYEKAIKTVQDLADSNIDWGATHEAWVFSIQSATQPTIVKILNNFKILSENQLHKRTSTRDYAFSIERLPFGHYAIGNYITGSVVQKLLLMTEDIYWEQCVIMTRKSSPFIPSLNLLILQIHETGLPYIWETMVALHYLDNQVQLTVKILSTGHHTDEEPIKLKLSHVEGIYVIWCIGLTFAIICFIAEIVTFKCLNKNKNKAFVY